MAMNNWRKWPQLVLNYILASALEESGKLGKPSVRATGI
jgi:hypothetical protein